MLFPNKCWSQKYVGPKKNFYPKKCWWLWIQIFCLASIARLQMRLQTRLKTCHKAISNCSKISERLQKYSRTIYRVYFNDFGKVSGYYMGKKASCEFWVVSSSPITWSILISSFQKNLWSFSNSPYLKVHKCENMQSTLKTSFFKIQLFFKHLCNESSDLFEILYLSF